MNTTRGLVFLALLVAAPSLTALASASPVLPERSAPTAAAATPVIRNVMFQRFWVEDAHTMVSNGNAASYFMVGPNATGVHRPERDRAMWPGMSNAGAAGAGIQFVRLHSGDPSFVRRLAWTL